MKTVSVLIGGVLIGIILVIVISIGIMALQGLPGSIQISKTTVQVVSGSVTVSPGNYVSYKFVIPSNTNGVLQGNFTAVGGSGNDIRVYVMDQTNFINYENGHGGSAYYISGQVTTGNIDITLPPGTYYVVFDNTFSFFSSKTVFAQITLTY